MNSSMQNGQTRQNDEIISNLDDYFKSWLNQNNKIIQKYYEQTFIRAKTMLILTVLTIIAGLIGITFSYIMGGIILVIACIFFYGYRQMLQELSIIYDRISINDKYVISLETVEKISDDTAKKELYTKIIESALKDVRQMSEGINEKY